MRPSAIVTFERLFLLSILLSTVQLALQAGARIGRVGPVTEIVIQAAGILLSVLLVLLASRRRSNIARWLLVAFTVYGLATSGLDLGNAIQAEEPIDLAWVLGLVGLALQTAAVAMLFSRGARGWFARRRVGSAEGGAD